MNESEGKSGTEGKGTGSRIPAYSAGVQSLLICGHYGCLRSVGIELVDERLERGCMAEQRCTIAMAARWGTGYIFELMENPLTLEKVKEKYGEVR